jgi:hypothetical protein
MTAARINGNPTGAATRSETFRNLSLNWVTNPSSGFRSRSSSILRPVQNMEFEGVFSAIVAAVLISIGVSGDWARWTKLRNESATAQAATHVADVARNGPVQLHSNHASQSRHSRSSILIESASMGMGASRRGQVSSIGCCPDAFFWKSNSRDRSPGSGLKFAGEFSLTDLPTSGNRVLLTGERTE